MKTVYVLTQPGDCEGRSVCTVGHFFDKGLALAVGKTGYKNSLMGPSEGSVHEIKVYENADDFILDQPTGMDTSRLIDLSQNAQELLRKQALAKLTDREKRALGLY